ncbi:MAG TPA: ABC transporter permease [Clostridiales bacterium]|nr:ABC transporter permease [Clostridiales bacterium]
MKIRTWCSFLKQGVKNAFGNKTMSVASIVAITAALCVLGVVMLIVLNLNYLMDDLESKLEVTVFLEKDVKDSDIKSIEKTIKSWEGVNEIEFVSKASALTKWKEELGDKAYLLDGYEGEENPLPDSFVIEIEKPEYTENIALKAQKLPRVMKVNYSKEVAEGLGKVVRTVRLVGLILVLVLAVIAAIIINNTVRLTVYSRRREINIMKYIGATDWYIRWPFIIEGFTIGVTGSLIAIAVIIPLYKYALGKFAGQHMAEGFFVNIFKLLPVEAVIYDVLLVFILVGVSVGVIGSIMSIRKHLKV